MTFRPRVKYFISNLWFDLIALNISWEILLTKLSKHFLLANAKYAVIFSYPITFLGEEGLKNQLVLDEVLKVH